MNSQCFVTSIHKEWDIVAARQMGRELAKKIGFGTVDQARITTAISELARNIYLYASKGQIKFEVIESLEQKGIKVVAEDSGPGIEDLSQVMEDGFSTSGGLGAGLPGVRRLMDEFDIISEIGKGTIINTIKWVR
ncbi:anti-sigma regulatory factor [Ornithinibacillus xuwenensis]|uniref:Anti-sigma regulatory factor n=1 Tax=Ornithinibacillus xuwenensis TaxID=3144668 RepID=A0ABU9XLQ9_9BACI